MKYVLMIALVIGNTCFAQECKTVESKMGKKDYEVVYDAAIRIKHMDGSVYNEAETTEKLKQYDISYKKFQKLMESSIGKMNLSYRPDKFIRYSNFYLIIEKDKLKLVVEVEEFSRKEANKLFEGYELTECAGIYRAGNLAAFEIQGDKLGQRYWLYE